LRGEGTLPFDTEPGIGERVLADHYLPGLSTPVDIIGTESAESELVAALRRTDGVAEVLPPVRSGDMVRIRVVLNDRFDTPAAGQTVQRLRSVVHGMPDARGLVGGPTAVM